MSNLETRQAPRLAASLSLVLSACFSGLNAPSAALADEPTAEVYVVRNQAHLTLAGARAAIAGAEAKARQMNLKVNIAVVDDGGHILAFARMDGARPASGYTALTKASTAATFRRETGRIDRGDLDATNALLLNLSMQDAAAASGGKLTTLPGGVPLVIDGQVVGAIGVGGSTGEQDQEIARAGISAILQSVLPENEGTR